MELRRMREIASRPLLGVCDEIGPNEGQIDELPRIAVMRWSSSADNSWEASNCFMRTAYSAIRLRPPHAGRPVPA